MVVFEKILILKLHKNCVIALLHLLFSLSSSFLSFFSLNLILVVFLYFILFPSLLCSSPPILSGPSHSHSHHLVYILVFSKVFLWMFSSLVSLFSFLCVLSTFSLSSLYLVVWMFSFWLFFRVLFRKICTKIFETRERFKEFSRKSTIFGKFLKTTLCAQEGNFSWMFANFPFCAQCFSFK